MDSYASSKNMNDSPSHANSPTISGREFIFIHGFTGSTDDFGNLPDILHEEFHAASWCPLLPGHGTHVSDLHDISHETLFAGIEKRIKESLSQEKEVVLVGLSLGAQAALHFAACYPVAGVIAVAATHGMKFPFNMRFLSLFAPLKPKWKKRFSPEDQELRRGSLCYDEMPSRALALSHQLRSSVLRNAGRIRSPVLFINSLHERLTEARDTVRLSRKIPARVSFRFLDNKTHSLFYSAAKDAAVRETVSFIRKERLFRGMDDRRNGEKATAVIPAYNEEVRIGRVLAALSRAPSINEIIVVDDGSKDGTGERTRAFPNVTILQNGKNAGKAESMERGVRRAKNDVIFFCDADLAGFRADHAEAILAPVLKGEYEMSIGERGNLSQQAVKAWALLSGERALRKRIWDELPRYYKHRYRIEAGLNAYVRHRTQKGLYARAYDYSQPVKESKYGLLRGTFLRWWMNVDVFFAYIRIFFTKR